MYQIDAICCVPFCGGCATLPQNSTPQTAQFIQALYFPRVLRTMIRSLIISIILFMLPMGAYQLYKIFALVNCDPKFGCNGTFELVMLIGAAFCLISMVSLVVVKVMFKTNIFSFPFLVATILLGCTHGYSLEFDFLQSTTVTAIFWLVFSGVVYSLAALVSKI